MTTDFKQAIPTVYQGIEFRSRLEAQTAFLIASLGYEAQYEPVSLMLDDGTTYRPDFWVPELRLWVEARGYSNEKGERQIAGFAKWIAEGRIAPDMTIRAPTVVREDSDGNIWWENDYEIGQRCSYLVLGEGMADFYEYGGVPASERVTSTLITWCATCQHYFIHHYGAPHLCTRCLMWPSDHRGGYVAQFTVHVRKGIILMEGHGERQTAQEWAAVYRYKEPTAKPE